MGSHILSPRRRLYDKGLRALLYFCGFLTTAIASEMSYASVGSLHRNALFSIGLVLFLFIMMINVFLNVFIKNKKEG